MGMMLTYSQVSELLGIKVSTLYSLVSRKRIPHVKLGRRLVRFQKDRLLEWVEDSMVLPG